MRRPARPAAGAGPSATPGQAPDLARVRAVRVLLQERRRAPRRLGRAAGPGQRLDRETLALLLEHARRELAAALLEDPQGAGGIALAQRLPRLLDQGRLGPQAICGRAR